MKAPTRKKTFAAAGASLALAATMVGVGFTYAPSTVQAQSAATSSAAHLFQAQPSGTPGPRPGFGRGQGQMDPAQRQQFEQQRQQQQAYINSLASHLNVTPDALNAAIKQARIDQINAAVAAGKIDQNRANQIIQAIQSGQGFMHEGGPRGGGQGPQGQGDPGMRGGGMLAASAIGITPDQLRTEMQGGKTLAQVAQAHGISRDDLKAKLTAAQKARLDQAVANGRMTADQETQILSRFSGNLDKMIDFVPGQNGQGPQGPRGPRGGPGASPSPAN
jgi:transposase-like protein